MSVVALTPTKTVSECFFPHRCCSDGLLSVPPHVSGSCEIPGRVGNVNNTLYYFLLHDVCLSSSFVDVDHGDFPETVLRGLETFLPQKAEHEIDPGAAIRGSRWKIPDEEIAKRRDLRRSRIFTIDPTGARDLDDALSVTLMADGTFEVGVHIADVTYFVRPNSDLDREARRRGTTVYLVQQASKVLV